MMTKGHAGGMRSGQMLMLRPRCRISCVPDNVRLAQAAMAKRDTKVSDLCKEIGVTRQTLYRFVDPKGGYVPTARSCSSANHDFVAHSRGKKVTTANSRRAAG